MTRLIEEDEYRKHYSGICVCKHVNTCNCTNTQSNILTILCTHARTQSSKRACSLITPRKRRKTHNTKKLHQIRIDSTPPRWSSRNIVPGLLPLVGFRDITNAKLRDTSKSICRNIFRADCYVSNFVRLPLPSYGRKLWKDTFIDFTHIDDFNLSTS